MTKNWKKHWTGLSVLILFFTAAAFSGCSDKKDGSKSEEPTSASQVKETAGEADITAAEADIAATEADIPSEETDIPQQPDKSPQPVHMGVWGTCGGTGFLFEMLGTKGNYIPYDMAEAKEYGARRDLELVSYNPKDGTCVINAYLQKKYIGQFKGTFEENEVEVDENTTHLIQSYSGIFTSVKGAKLDFNFHAD